MLLKCKCCGDIIKVNNTRQVNGILIKNHICFKCCYGLSSGLSELYTEDSPTIKKNGTNYTSYYDSEQDTIEYEPIFNIEEIEI